MNTAEQYLDGHEFDAPIVREENMINFTKSHFDQAIKELEKERDRIKEDQKDNSLLSILVDTFNANIQTLKDYKKKIL